MANRRRFESGTALEARIQRLFICQGAFAERGLFMRASRGDSKMVTDIDVVAHDYSINFHHRRIYAECKGGKNKSPLDRIVWIRGVKEAIGAEFAHLVLESCDPSTALFGRTLGIEVLQAASIDALEVALRIPEMFWPGRSNLHAYGAVEAKIKDQLKKKTRGDAFHEWLSRAAESWRESSALTFSYGRLNALFGVLLDAHKLTSLPADPDRSELLAYAIGALLVRLSQYVLFVASDTLSMTSTERRRHVSERFVSGNLEFEQSKRLMNNALKMVNAQLAAMKVEAPVSWNVDHMLSPPTYTDPFVEVVERSISEGERARMLPLSMELRIFGYKPPDAGIQMIDRARDSGSLAGLIIAFARQSLSVPGGVVREPVSTVEGVLSLNGSPPSSGTLFEKI
jgi:hypothetical protein